uniref:HAP2 n=1 Tax=Babesia bigemina TaxID=5866 RepID=A0A2D0ZCX1_BABBI|nr:HAP2 [Babesia bigemina]
MTHAVLNRSYKSPLRVAACLLALLIGAAVRPASAVIISPVRQCIDKGGRSVAEGDCEWRSHTNIDVKGGEETASYVLRRKDKPNSGLYIHIQTSLTTLSYELEYIMDVPSQYREHNRSVDYSAMTGGCNNCDALDLEICSKPDALPPSIQDSFNNKACCVCGKNVTDYSPRADFSCTGFGAAFMHGKCVSMSCLEVVGPWYSIFKPAYPPTIHRRVFVDVYAFDGDAGVVPDVAKNGYYTSDDADETRYLKEAVYKDKHLKATLSAEKQAVKNEELDVTLTIITQQWLDGNAPQKMDKFVAVPSWPETDKTVQGSSRKYNCDQEGRDPHDCEHDDVRCRMEKCALNVRTIESDAIDTTGTQCDKIGVSMGTWGNEGRLCNTAPNSCIQNQLGWYLSERKERVGSGLERPHCVQALLPKLYGVQPMLARREVRKSKQAAAMEEPESLAEESRTSTAKSAWRGPATYGAEDEDEGEEDEDEGEEDEDEEPDEWHDDTYVHAVAYSIAKADTSRIEINTFDATVTQIIAEAVGFIVSATMDGPCKVASHEACTMKIVTKNAGKIRAKFSHRIQCYEAEKPHTSPAASSEEQSVQVEPNSTTSSVVPIKILSGEGSDKLECEVQLYSSTVSLLETFVVKASLATPTITVGPDVRSFDKFTDTSKEDHELKIGAMLSDNMCTCNAGEVGCFFRNFGKCMRHAFNKYYTWFVLGITGLSFLALLPVFIPLARVVFGKISEGRARARVRREAAQEIERIRREIHHDEERYGRPEFRSRHSDEV